MPDVRPRPPLRIARIIARLNVGGPARHVTWLTQAFNDERFTSVLITGKVPPGEQDMTYFANAAGVRPVVVDEMSRAISWRDAIVVWRLFRLLREFGPDVVHTHTAKAGTVGRAAALLYRMTTRRRCAIVHTFHGHVFHSYYGRLATSLFLLIERCLARFTDRIIVLSPRQLEEINGTFRIGRPAQFRVVPLGLDLASFRSDDESRDVRSELGIEHDAFVVGTVGRLTEVKDYPFFLTAAARWIEANPARAHRLRFVLVGDGHLRQELEALAASLGIGERVVFAGSRSDPETFYRAFDAFVLTSRNEGTPLTMLEAMASRLPVLSTRVGGVPDLVGECGSVRDGVSICERGLLIESGDAAAFANAISMLLDDPAMRRSHAAAGCDFVQAHHGKDRLLRDLARLYDELAGA